MTTARSTLASVRKELTIKASQARAFRTFTELTDEWWPRSHHIGKVELKKAVLEPRQGGRWYEIGMDGSLGVQLGAGASLGSFSQVDPSLGNQR